ncbi:MAG: hypothetical protein COS40_06805 [Deltaproteobacteria bacterium CG03_land_8_20_14_0_80_45_14]|nr:MAG: hypothetical protein COS40_06805 [Deltaproteobacteria bacterium CG03_land_8_20_14_0_80_45_14]
MIWLSRCVDLVKSLKRLFSVIPAPAFAGVNSSRPAPHLMRGIQPFQVFRILWIPVFTGMTTFYDATKERKSEYRGKNWRGK